MSDPFADTMSMLDNWERNAAEKAARFQAMNDRVAQVTITESVAGGAVSATVGNNGLPVHIAMTDRVREMSPDEIAANVMAAIRKAQSRYPQVLAEIVAETVGEDPAGQHILATAEQNFPAPVEEESPAAGERRSRIGDIEDEAAPVAPPRPPRRPSTRDDGDDGDFSDRSFLK
jgi:DNA-binding protein YbaB